MTGLQRPEAGPEQPDTPRSWSSRSLGTRWQHGVFYTLIRFLGLKPTKILLFFVVLVFCLRPSIARRSKWYFERRFGKTRPATAFARVFRLYWTFGCILLERAATGVLGARNSFASTACLATLQGLLAQGRGVILLSAHVGPWQIALADLCGYATVNIVQPSGAGDVDRHFFEHQRGGVKAAIRVIDPLQGFGGYVDAAAALKRGEIVCLMGDRIPPDEKRIARVSFLEKEAFFPVSPYVLAAMTGAPLAMVFARRLKEGAVECFCPGVMRIEPGLARNEKALRPYTAGFVQALEAYVADTPYQFFNFHNIWAS